jgi:hypothetical protein
MYEHRTAQLLPWPAFVRRMLRHGGYVLAVAGFSIAFGMVGFHILARQSWIDAFLNAAMLLGGMGPVGEIQSDGGKLFAGVFALYAGLFFIAAFAVLTAPLLHRLVHKFHAEEERTARRPARNAKR